jgi:colanic acid biosynthesis glycosyl transferase WcaI
MKRIIFLNRYFFPDHSATSQILADLAFHLASCGHDVHVITSQQLYDQPRACLPAWEVIDGVTVHRLVTTRFGRSALPGRGLDYLSFFFAARRAILAIAAPGDIVVAKTDPPLIGLVAMQAARERSLHLVNWLQDIYPEIAMQLGLPLVSGPLGRGLARLRDLSLHAGAANVVVGNRMADTLRARGIGSDKIHVVANWCDDETIRPVASADNPLRREWGLDQQFVVGYSGNLGQAHEFDTVLAAAERLREDRIIFLVIGGGSKFEQLGRRVKEYRLDRLIRLVPYQARQLLTYSLSAPDVHWVSLKAQLEGLIVPSKFYGIAAAGRPIIAITAPDGELARLVRQHGCGCVVAPGDAAALADTLRHLSTDREARIAMGLRARQMLDAHFTRRQALQQWRTLLESIGSPRAAAGSVTSPGI